jgi:hypothetical protein
MIADITEVWKAAANAAFNGGKCVHGSLLKRDVVFDDKNEKREIDAEVLKRSFAPIKRGTRRVPDAMWSARNGRKVST